MGTASELRLLATTASSPGSLIMVDVNGGTNVNISNLSLVGDNTASTRDGKSNLCQPSGPLEWQYGVTFDGTRGGSLTDVNISHICGDFVEMQAYQTGGPPYTYAQRRPASNITITGGTFSVAGRQGFGLTDVTGATINGVTVMHVAQDAVDVESGMATDPASSVTVETAHSQTSPIRCLPTMDPRKVHKGRSS